MNTTKQVNVILGLLMVGAIATLLYFLWDNLEREDDAQARQLMENAERGGELFALNCASCHGLNGKGLLERGSLPGAPLNVEAKRPTARDEVKVNVARFRDTIRCGRIGTLMPAWSSQQGGALNDFQILQLVALITGVMLPEDGVITAKDIPADPNAVSEEGWARALDAVNHAQDFDPPKEITEAVDDTVTTLTVNDASGLKANDLVRIGGEKPDSGYELVTIVDVAGTAIEVKRGVEGTEAAKHEQGTELFGAPVLPGTTINGSVGTPPCGQLAAAAGSPTPAASPVVVSGSIAISLGDNFFDLNGSRNPNLAVKAGTSVSVQLTNSGSAIHNMVIAGPDGAFGTDDDVISVPDAIKGGESGTLTFTLAAGTFAYQCDFHPAQMNGEIIVTQ